MIKLKQIAAAFCSIGVMLCTATAAHAAGPTFLTMEYSDDTRQIISSTDDLFSNITTLMPGDTFSDTLKIENKNKNSIELFFNSVPLSKDEYQLEEDFKLLSKISLKIENNDKLIYDGNLAGDAISKAVSLGKYKSGEKSEFKFTLNVDPSITNEYNMTETKIKWHFSLTEDEIKKDSSSVPEVTTSRPTTNYTSAPATITKTNDGGTDTTPSPYTGYKIGSSVVGILAIAGLCMVIKSRKDGK